MIAMAVSIEKSKVQREQNDAEVLPEEGTEVEHVVRREKKPNALKRGVRRFKSDISDSAKINDNSLAQHIGQFWRSMFPKKK